MCCPKDLRLNSFSSAAGEGQRAILELSRGQTVRVPSSISLAAVTSVPLTKWFNDIHLFLTILEAEESKIKTPTALMSGESLLPGS